MSDIRRSLADNVALILAARFAMILFAPLTLALVVWILSTIRSSERMIDKHELRIEINEREIRIVKESRTQELQALHASLASIHARLGQIETNIAVQTQQQKEGDRRLEEFKAYLEGRLGIKPPR